MNVFFKRGEKDGESKTAAVILMIIFLIAMLTYYLSRQDPVQLQDKARTRAAELRALQQRGADDLGIERTLMVYMVQDERQSFFVEALKHVSLALFVSCILIVAVDTHTRRAARRDLQRHLQQVTENVFAGVAQRLLGSKTATELASILRQDFAKDNCGYQFTFLPLSEAKLPDRVVALFETWYSLRNLSNSPAEFPFEVSLIGQEKGEVTINGDRVELPHFVSVKIAGKEIAGNQFRKEGEPLRVKQRVFLSEDPEARVQVYAAVRLLYRTRGAEVLFSDVVMEGSSIVVVNQAPQLIDKCEASVLHPAYAEVTSPATGRWEFARPLLPGQGWYVTWEPPAEPKQANLFDSTDRIATS